MGSYYVAPCTGCYEGGENDGMAHLYPYDEKAECRVGAGCEECGYTGKRRVPVPSEDEVRELMKGGVDGS